MEKKNTLLLTVIAVATLLVAVVGATFAYFGSFSVNNQSRANVNVKTDEAIGSSLISTGADISIHVTGQQMTYDPTKTETDKVDVSGATDNGTLTVTLDANSAATITTCTYDIVFQYDSGATVYGPGGKGPTKYGADNANSLDGKEFTYQYAVVAPTGPATPAADEKITMLKDENTEHSFSDFSGATSLENAVKVGSGKISTSQGATTDTKYVQQVKFTVKFYNFPSIAQDAVANGNYKGAFFIKNEACSSVPRS